MPRTYTAPAFTAAARPARVVLLGLLVVAALAPLVFAGAPAPQDGAGAGTSGDLPWGELIMGLAGGLAIFLYGMDQMAEGLKAAAGDSLTRILAKLTTNRFAGAGTGAFVTAVLNSSSVTTVLVVGFITAGVMTLQQSIGVIMGANVGSTVTAQIIAFQVTKYALAMIAVGFGLLFVGKTDKLRSGGKMLMGLGLVFFGVGIMGDAMGPLRTYQPFLDLMVRMENPLLGLLVGAAFTGLVQSSAATTGIAITMAADGLITLPAGIALALGSNIGTCITALMAAIGKPVEAVRASVAHTLFNVVGVALWVGFIPLLADIVVSISPDAPGLEGQELMAATVPRQIANAHTVFNIVNTFLFIGFTGVFAAAVQKLIPARAPKEVVLVTPRYLDDALLDAPSAALGLVRRELGHLGEITVSMLGSVRPALANRSHEELDAIEREDDRADMLHAAIVDYLGEIRQRPMTEAQNEQFLKLLRGTDELERVGDVVETDLVALGRELLARKLSAGDTERDVLRELYELVLRSLGRSVEAVVEQDQTAAAEVLRADAEINRLVGELLLQQARNVDSSDAEFVTRFRIEDEIISALKRIHSLAKRVARLVAPPVIVTEAA